MRKINFTVALFLIIASNCFAQDVYNLWENLEKPFYKENTLKEGSKKIWGTKCLFNITNPTLTIFRAKGNNTGKAVVIMPGGGYQVVAIDHEGYQVAEKLSEYGITAAVLKYRLPNRETSDQPHMATLSDARRAITLLRSNADKYGINKNKVGVMGFSAGSHLASLVSLWTSNNAEDKPDFSVLLYGSNDLTEENMGWLKTKFYCREMSTEEIQQNILLDLVSENTPPTFLVHAYDDPVCHVNGSSLYAQKLFEHGVTVEMHLFSKGGHGFGLGKEGSTTSQWLPLFVNWLKTL